VSTVRQYNLLNQQAYQPIVKQETDEVDEVELEQQQSKNKKPNKKSIYALVGIVPVLLGLAVVMYAQFQAPPPKPAAQATSATPIPQAATPVQLVTVAPNVSTASISGNLQTQSLTVQIVSTSNSAASAQSLLARLDTYKFKSVSLQSESSVGSASTLVSFSPNTTQDVRDVVLSEVKKFETNVIVQEKQLGTFDISIVLGQ